MVTDCSLLEVKVKEHGKALKEQFLLIFLSVVEGVFTAEKNATISCLLPLLKNLVVMTSAISCFFQLVWKVLFDMYSSDFSFIFSSFPADCW